MELEAAKIRGVGDGGLSCQLGWKFGIMDLLKRADGQPYWITMFNAHISSYEISFYSSMYILFCLSGIRFFSQALITEVIIF